MLIDAGRLRERMKACGLSQAQLARRVGVTQQTVAKLVSGQAVGSRYLHLIARELGTTPAWLTGETDDPDAELPDDALTAEERESLEHLRQLQPEQRAAVMQLIRSLTGDKGAATVHAPRHAYRGQARD